MANLLSCVTVAVGLLAAFAVGSARAQVTCPTDPYPYDGGYEPRTPGGAQRVRSVAIDDTCKQFYTVVHDTNVTSNGIPVTDMVVIQSVSEKAAREYLIPVGPDSYGIDVAPDTAFTTPQLPATARGRVFVANAGDRSMSVIDFADAASWNTPAKVAVPIPTGATQRPMHIAVAKTGIVLIGTDAGNGTPLVFSYNPETRVFRNRTNDIPGALTSATVKASADRSLVSGITTSAGTYGYLADTDRFAAAPPPYAHGQYSGLSMPDVDGKLRYVTSPYAKDREGTLAIFNPATNAIVARMPSSTPILAPDAVDLSKDGGMMAQVTRTGVRLISTKPFYPVQMIALGTGEARSVVRVHNSGAAPGAVVISLINASTGERYGAWTSPVIPAGAAVQYHLATIEGALGISAPPSHYTMRVEAPRGFYGSVQHLIWQPELGTLTNFSTCDRDTLHRNEYYAKDGRARLTTDPHQLPGVHSTLFQDYPSYIVATRWDDGPPTPVTLGVYDGRNGAKLGELTTPPIVGKSFVRIDVKLLESQLQIRPTADQQYYVIVAPASFKGFLRHDMESKISGMTTDLTPACPLNSDYQNMQPLGLPDGPANDTIDIGRIYSTAELWKDEVSFFHISNETAVAQRISMNLRYLGPSGPVTRTWTSPPVPANGELQILTEQIERESAGPPLSLYKPPLYTATINMPFKGAVQHYLWRPQAQSLVNASTCSAAAPSDPHRLMAVHSSMYDIDYPSLVVVHNSKSRESSTYIRVTGTDGKLLGTYETPMIPAEGHLAIPISQIEGALGIQPSWDVPRYNLYLYLIDGQYQGPEYYSGAAGAVFWLQHMVVNRSTFLIEDMTHSCRSFPAGGIIR